MVEVSHAPPPERRHSGGPSRTHVPASHHADARASDSARRSRTPPWQRDMPRNGDCTLVKLNRTGPVYVRVDGVPMIGSGAARGIATSKLQELIKDDMYRQTAGVRGFEDVHIYSRPFHQPGYAIFVFDSEAAAYVGFHTLIQTFVDNQMTMSWRPSSIMVFRRSSVLAPLERDRRLKERATSEHLHAGPLLRSEEDRLPTADIVIEQAPYETRAQSNGDSVGTLAPQSLPGPPPLPGPPAQPASTPEIDPSDGPPPPPPEPPPQDVQACKAEERSKQADGQPLSGYTKEEGTDLAKVDIADDKAATGWLPPLPDEARPKSATADHELGRMAASDWLPPLPDEAPQSSLAAAAEHEAGPWPRPLPGLDSAPLPPYFPPGVALREGADPQTAVLPPGIGVPEPMHAAAGTEPAQAPPLLPVDADMLLPPHLRRQDGPSAVSGEPVMQPLRPTDGAPLPLGQGFRAPPWAVIAREGPQPESIPARPPPQGLTDSQASTPSPERVPLSLCEGNRTPVWTGPAQQDAQLPAAYTEGPTGAPVPLDRYDRMPSWAGAAWPDERLPAGAGIPQPAQFPAQSGFPENVYEAEPPGEPSLSLSHFLRDPPRSLSLLSGRGSPHEGGLPGPPSLELRHFLPDNLGAAWQPHGATPQPRHSAAAHLSSSTGGLAIGKMHAGEGLQPAAHRVQQEAAPPTDRPGASLPTASECARGIAFACHAPSRLVQTKRARLPAFSMSSQDSAAEQSLPNEAVQQEVQHLRTQQTATPCSDRREAVRPLVTGHSDGPPCTEQKSVEVQPQKQSAGVRPPADERAERPALSVLGNRSAQPQKQAVGVKRSREDEPVRKRFETGRRTVSKAPQAGPPDVRKYPSRPGQKACDFYMRTGGCKYGMKCKFDHPNPGLETPEAGRGTGPEPTPVLPSSGIRKEESRADIRDSAAVKLHSAGGTPHSSENAAHAREPAPLNTACRPGSRAGTPTAERRSSGKTAAGLKADAQEHRHPRSRDSTPLHRGRRSGSRDDTSLAERLRMKRVALWQRSDAQRGQKPYSRDPTPLRREERPGSRDGSPRAERRSRSRDPRSRDHTPRSRDHTPRSSERVSPRLEAATRKDRTSQALQREERLHQLHEARRAGKPMQPSSRRSRERSQSRLEPLDRASIGSDLKRGTAPQESSRFETCREQPDGNNTSDTASDGHPAAKRRLLEPHRDARRLAPDRTPTPMAADSKPKSKGASPAQGLTTPALDWSPGNTFDVTPEVAITTSQHAGSMGSEAQHTDAPPPVQQHRQPEEAPASAKVYAQTYRAASQGQPLSPGKLARLDQELCRLLGDTMRESRGKLRMEHFSPQTLDRLAEMPPERGKLILENLRNRNWREVPNITQAVWVTVKHFK